MQDVFNAGLDEIFATKLAESHEFRSWFLSRTKFARLWPLARLLKDEQQAAQGDDAWWRNWRSESAGECPVRRLSATILIQSPTASSGARSISQARNAQSWRNVCG